jgi:hypothetical protein
MTEENMKEYENPTYPIFHWDVVQKTEEWNDLRRAKITASIAKTFLVVGKGIGGLGAGAITELYRIVEEKLSGVAREGFGGSKATDHGNLNEPLAAECYENLYFRKIKPVGFVSRSEWTGASPDGLIPEIEKGVEIKCFPKEHMKIIDSGKYRQDEVVQIQFNLWCTSYKTWDLIYFHPNLPEKARMKVHTLIPDPEMHARFNQMEKEFVKIVNEKVCKYV